MTGMELPESLCFPISGVSREGVLECPSELNASEEPDCLESRPFTASSCLLKWKEGIGGCWMPGTGFRRSEVLERLDFSERFELSRSADSVGGRGGKALGGEAPDIAIDYPARGTPSLMYVPG